MNDELEHLITLSLDGLLGPEEQARVDALVASDPEARRLREEYAALDVQLKTALLPAVDFERLDKQISRAIDAYDPPALSFRFPGWTRWSAAITAAACIIISFTIWGHHSRPEPMAVNPSARPATVAEAQAGLVEVAVMNAGGINAEPLAAISVGPEPGREKIDLPAREAMTAPRSAVAIDSAAVPAQDTDRPIY